VALVGVFLMCLVGFGSYFIVYKQLKKEFDQKVSENEKILNENKRYGFVTTKELIAGDILTEENVEYKEYFSSDMVEASIGKESLGMKVRINVPENTQLTSFMMADSEITGDTREVCYNVITLSPNIKSGDYCDVRIVYPNGVSKVVLPKKRLLNLSEGSTDSYVYCTEEDINLMDSAVVDAYLYGGTKLYVTKYIEPNMQQASIVNYTPTQDVINLIKVNPNIVEIATNYLSNVVRMELENSLAVFSKKDITQEWSFEEITTQKTEEVNEEKIKTEDVKKPDQEEKKPEQVSEVSKNQEEERQDSYFDSVTEEDGGTKVNGN